MIKLVVLDVDGTLSEKDRRIAPEVVETLPKVQERGTLISLVSGNVIPVMYALKTYLGINGPVFGENGGVILSNDSIETFFTKEVPLKFFKYLQNRASISEILTNRWRETSVAFSADREAMLNEIARTPGEWLNRVEIVDSTYAWHIMSKGQTKAFAIRKLIEMFGLGKDEVLVCGDSDNDYAMYEVPVRKATVANATDSIKEECEYISDESHGRGVIDIFRHFGLL
ncbi:hypothetical protein IX51_10985 [uncultured archaeon]|nr:hypothetical protein IX51_10985 [uncultured archaeon]HKJ96672.1 phosphoglycolate phosphatase [Thermoplasmataceae archaeon]